MGSSLEANTLIVTMSSRLPSTRRVAGDRVYAFPGERSSRPPMYPPSRFTTTSDAASRPTPSWSRRRALPAGESFRPSSEA